ncbi:MAG: hypothetical protein JO157_01285 [Acetobacteraceae bacterium]|nr:hypothetical protein [Acetobacteraceae bacterium]
MVAASCSSPARSASPRLARECVHGCHRLGPRLGDVRERCAGQAPAAHARVIVPGFELREQPSGRVPQPLRRAPDQLKLRSDLVQGKAGAGSGHRESEAQQPSQEFIAHPPMRHGPALPRNHPAATPQMKPAATRLPHRGSTVETSAAMPHFPVQEDQ